jgi:hypothetical protein
MNPTIRRLVLAFALVVLLLGARSARADSYTVTFASGLTGVLNLTATAQGGGSFLISGVTGSENGLPVGGLIAPNSSGFYAMPDGTGFTYDDLLFPTSPTVFDNGGLLFTLVASNGSTIFENLYSNGTSLYMESAYLANGGSFPSDYSWVPVTFTLVDPPPVATPEPSTLALCLVSMVVFVAWMSKQKKALA